MAISDAVQTLSAAFAFGILLQAASGALFIYYRGHGSTIFQDGRRLALILFLLFAALWAQMEFLNLLLTRSMGGACQATLIVSTLFDQLARVGMEQFLLWSVGHGTKLTAERLILQAILLLRMIGGGLLVGFTRPQFAPVCVARTSILPISIVVLSLDAVIIGALMIRAVSLGMFKEMGAKNAGTRQEQSKALVCTIVGFGVWTGTSVPMILGIPSIILMLRTVLPANGLLVLVGVVTMFPGALLLAREENGTTPEASSPFANPMPPSREIFRENVRSVGSPVSNYTDTRNGLFVVNPSATPRESTGFFQGSLKSDTRRFTKLADETSVREVDDDFERSQRQLEVKGPGYRGSSGIFPSLTASVSRAGVQGALAPQIRPSESARPQHMRPPVVQQKRSMFNWSKAAEKPSVRTLKISQPFAIDSDGATTQSFAKIPTIDLARAASIERKRREEASTRSRLVATRPAPQPPQSSDQDALRRVTSIKRKELTKSLLQPLPPLPSGLSSNGLSLPVTNGSTTSASLSPGREEVRRRSPRQLDNFDQAFDQAGTTPPQRMNTTGLPSNPRAQRITIAQKPAPAEEPTIMFMNDIVYNDPAMVQSIEQSAPGIYASAQKSRKVERSAFSMTTASLKSHTSVIHRPRPYKRGDSAMFTSPGHRRSRSGGDLSNKRLIFMSQPGSPTQLPPLPPCPLTSSAHLKRLLPNDTKSMTFDEKIELLFPAPPGTLSMQRRRSSVPSLPRLPSVYMFDSPTIRSPVDEGQMSRRASKRTTIASFAAPDLAAHSGLNLSIGRPEETQAYRFSANTYRNIADEVGGAWVPEDAEHGEQSPKDRDIEPKASGRLSVRSNVRRSDWTELSTNDESFLGDRTTYLGSVHSQVVPVDLSKARQNATSTYIQRPDIRHSRVISETPVPMPVQEVEECDGLVPVMFIPEADERPLSSSVDDYRRSFLLDADQALPGDKTPVTIKDNRGWHHRIGDELPTFSDRSSKQRKMPPPTPLLLSKNGKRATVMVRAAEPSPPTDSPERAIKEIQEQLRRFEEPNRGSVGSLLRHLPGDGPEKAPDTGRFRLLENLEREMGQQEDQWQQLQSNLDRESVSVVMSPYTQAQMEEETSSQDSSRRSSRASLKIVARRSRTRSSMTGQSKSENSSRTTSTQSSDASRASVWQQRLAEAQIEYMEKAPALLRKRSLNFLSVTKGHVQAPIMSPTPPDSVQSETDSESEFESESDVEDPKYQQSLPEGKKEKATLWQWPLPSPKAAAGRMWNPPYETSVSLRVAVDPPAKNVRPTRRRLESALPISSRELWQKPRSAPHSRPVVALWGSKLVRPKSIKTRPLTQRPQRKSRRVTFLPDIVESPVPLPNKRETLGIFQFPWGEKSDQPVYLPTFNPMLLAGPTINANLDARSKQLESSEYSSSFFDDYDDDEGTDPDSDDDFDETTLWEIASLLSSSDVPSRDSLFPASKGEEIEDYDTAVGLGDAAPPPVADLPVLPLALNSRPQLWTGAEPASEKPSTGLQQPAPVAWNAFIPAADDTVRSKPSFLRKLPVVSSTDLWITPSEEVADPLISSMWSQGTVVEKQSLSSTASATSLPISMWSPQPERLDNRKSGMFTIPAEIIRSTQASPAVLKMVKATRQHVDGPSKISSTSLWTPAEHMQQPTSWSSKVPATQEVQVILRQTWTAPAKALAVENTGLFDITVRRVDYRSTDAIPAAINMICKPRTTVSPIIKLSSTKLWNGGARQPVEHHWISESSVHPQSPSVYSTTSSGNTTPTSDSASLRSNSTKASSLWSAVGSTALSWWDRSAKKSPSGSPTDETKQSPKMPLRQAPSAPLAPIRESRFMASRAMFETKGPIVNDAPSKRMRRGTIAQPSITALPKQLTKRLPRATAFLTAWDDALTEAIKAGRPAKTPRQAASKADWESALLDAIRSSRPRFVRHTYSAVQWDTALTEAISAGAVRPMPSTVYDVALLHPVFFTSSLVSSCSDIHPAAIGYVVKQAPSKMWTAAFKNTSSSSDGLWLKKSVISEAEVAKTQLSGSLVRKTPVLRNNSLPVLQSTEFWAPSQTASQERFWLTAGKPSTNKPTLSNMWTASPEQDTQSAPGMWSKDTMRPRVAVAISQLNVLPVRLVPVPRNSPLPVLQSTQLWTSSNIAPKERIWLNASRSTTAPTWVSQVVSASKVDEKSVKMWTQATPTASSSPDVFAHVKATLVKKSSTSVRQALPKIQSTELFQVTYAAIPKQETHWLHDTSSAASISMAQPLTWTATPATSAHQPSNMWEKNQSSSSTAPSLFTNTQAQPWTHSKREAGAMVNIESTDLWRASRNGRASPRNWLVQKRVSRVEFRY